jgi:hypothetical protein
MSGWEGPAEIAATGSVLVFWSACVLVLLRPRFGYGLGLLAGLVALPWFVRTELSLDPWNSWIFLNYELPMLPHSEGTWSLTFVVLRILSAALIVIAIVCLHCV